jgi:hypothetical protein
MSYGNDVPRAKGFDGGSDRQDTELRRGTAFGVVWHEERNRRDADDRRADDDRSAPSLDGL